MQKAGIIIGQKQDGLRECAKGRTRRGPRVPFGLMRGKVSGKDIIRFRLAPRGPRGPRRRNFFSVGGCHPEQGREKIENNDKRLQKECHYRFSRIRLTPKGDRKTARPVATRRAGTYRTM